MPLQGEKIHTRVWQQSTINTKKSGEKGDLLRREMMRSPWETPLCCTDTRRRFSVLGISAERITRVKGTLPAHVVVFLPFTQWFSAVISFENDSSRSTRILKLLRGPDTLREAGLCSSSGEGRAAPGGGSPDVTSHTRTQTLQRSGLIVAYSDCLIKKLWSK